MSTATRVLAIVPDDQLRTELIQELGRIPAVELARPLATYPGLDEFLRSLRIQKPDFLIVEVDDLPKAQALLNNLDELMPWLPLIGIARHIDETSAHQLMRLGIREYLVAPVTHDRLIDLIEFVRIELARRPRPVVRPADLYTFFPAKPGVGTSTIALSASCVLAEQFSLRTLLLDCDLAAGVVGFHLKLGNSASIVDVLNHAENLDADLWQQMVARSDKLEVLPAGNLMPPPFINPASLQRVLSIARAQYEVICADLGSVLDDLSITLLRESQKIFLITTPEVAPIFLAQARVRSLRDLGLAERVTLVLNRKDHKRDRFDSKEVAEAVGMPVAYTVGNDYRTCSDAILKGSSICRESDIGRDILNLAQSLRGDPAQKPIPASHPRKFLEFFHIAHAEDPTTTWHD